MNRFTPTQHVTAALHQFMKALGECLVGMMRPSLGGCAPNPVSWEQEMCARRQASQRSTATRSASDCVEKPVV
jgi:hypothetical protein